MKRFIVTLVFLVSVLLAGCTNGPVPASATVAPTVPEPTAAPTDVPTATPTEVPTEVPTPTATPTEVVWEYDRAFLDMVYTDCRKFSGGPMGEQEELNYMSVLLQVVGFDLDSSDLPLWTSGFRIDGTPLLTRTQYLDPNLEYCYVVLLVDDGEYSELLNVFAPLVPGLLVYEAASGEFVVLEVQPAVTE